MTSDEMPDGVETAGFGAVDDVATLAGDGFAEPICALLPFCDAHPDSTKMRPINPK